MIAEDAAALSASGVSSDHVSRIAFDFTACTVLPTPADGTPLRRADELEVAEP